MNNVSCRKVDVPDGRQIACTHFGDPEGEPVVYCHGWPGSRVEARFTDATAKEQGYRILAIDRPGMGQSGFMADRSMRHWPDDVLATVEAHGVSRFSVLGVSGGGPYALACAARIPDRLKRVGVVSTLGPVDVPPIRSRLPVSHRMMFMLGRKAVPFMELALALFIRSCRSNPDRFQRLLLPHLPEPDRAVRSRPEVRTVLEASISESFAHGARGPAHDFRLLSSPWPFRVDEIATEVHLWHGGADRHVPPCMGEYLAKTLPRCRSRFLPPEGHYSLVLNHLADILGPLRD